MKQNINAVSVLAWGAVLALVIVAFTGIDYAFHTLTPDWAVPGYYFRNKLIFGFLLSIPALYISSLLRRVWLKALVFSAVISVLLQARYLLSGYPLDFVIIFLFIHFGILVLLSLFTFYLAERRRPS